MEDYSEFKDVKNTMEEAKMYGLKYRINFGLLKQDLDPCEKKEMLTWIVNEWGIHVTGLHLALNGNEDFLLEEFFKFPHLEKLRLEVKVWPRDGRNSYLVIEKELIKRHANSLTKLSVHGYDDRFPLKIHLPHIEEVKFEKVLWGGQTINSLLLACRKTVKRIEFDGCHSYVCEVNLPKLLHISIRRCDREFYEFAEQYAKQLTTLKLVGLTEVYLYDLEREVKFRNLTHLWIGEVDRVSCGKFLKYCSSKIEHLVVEFEESLCDDIEDKYEDEDELNFPKLRDLYIMNVGPRKVIFNCENLEFLCISWGKTSFYRDNDLDECILKYPNLKTLLLPGCINDALVAKLKAKYSSRIIKEISDTGLQVLTLKEQCNEAMRLRAKKFNQCLDLVPIISDECLIR